MTSQKRDPPPRLRQTLAISGQFAISSTRRSSVFRSVPVSKLEQSPEKYNVEQIKTMLKCKGLKQSGK